jgi:hypothetical protein
MGFLRSFFDGNWKHYDPEDIKRAEKFMREIELTRGLVEIFSERRNFVFADETKREYERLTDEHLTSLRRKDRRIGKRRSNSVRSRSDYILPKKFAQGMREEEEILTRLIIS